MGGRSPRLVLAIGVVVAVSLFVIARRPDRPAGAVSREESAESLDRVTSARASIPNSLETPVETPAQGERLVAAGAAGTERAVAVVPRTPAIVRIADPAALLAEAAPRFAETFERSAALHADVAFAHDGHAYELRLACPGGLPTERDFAADLDLADGGVVTLFVRARPGLRAFAELADPGLSALADLHIEASREDGSPCRSLEVFLRDSGVRRELHDESGIPCGTLTHRRLAYPRRGSARVGWLTVPDVPLGARLLAVVEEPETGESAVIERDHDGQPLEVRCRSGVRLTGRLVVRGEGATLPRSMRARVTWGPAGSADHRFLGASPRSQEWRPVELGAGGEFAVPCSLEGLDADGMELRLECALDGFLPRKLAVQPQGRRYVDLGIIELISTVSEPR